MANYAKWDAFDAGSSDDEGPGPTPAAEFGIRTLSEWITSANPGLAKAEVDKLIDFIEVQQPRLGHTDNLPRASALIEWVETNGTVDSEHLLEVVWQARLYFCDEPGEAARFVRMKAALTSALNTSKAIDECGGARALFDTMWKVCACLSCDPHSAPVIARPVWHRNHLATSRRGTANISLRMMLSRSTPQRPSRSVPPCAPTSRPWWAEPTHVLRRRIRHCERRTRSSTRRSLHKLHRPSLPILLAKRSREKEAMMLKM